MLPLIGILIVIVGFALRLNALLVVTLAGVATGLASGPSLTDVIAAIGKAFVDSRYIAIVWLALPVIGLAERSGLKERSREVISRITAATAGRARCWTPWTWRPARARWWPSPASPETASRRWPSC